VLGLGLAEGLVRLLGHRGCDAGTQPLWRPRRDVGWALVPGAQGEVLVCRGDREIARHTVVINALGQRDRPRTYGHSGTPRVLVLGDSFVEAMQVDLDETFSARLERELGIEMLNAGVSGYSTDNELRAFVGRGRAYAPDAVLLVFYVGNDVLENGARLYLRDPHGLPPKPWLRARAPSRGLAACLALHRAAARAAEASPDLLWSSRVLRFALTRGIQDLLERGCAGAVGPPLGEGVPEIFGVYQPSSTPAWTEAWAATEAMLRRFATRVRASGARFGVALAPAGLEIDPGMRAWHDLFFPSVRGRAWDFGYPYRRLAGFFDREGIVWMSLLPPLRAHRAATGRSGYFDWDTHWDSEGHAVVAEALRDFVLALDAPPDPRRRVDSLLENDELAHGVPREPPGPRDAARQESFGSP